MYILVPIALFSSLSRRGLGTSGDIGFSRTSGLHVCSRDASIYGMGLKMVALESVFEESLFQASNVINLENVSVRKR